MQSPIKVSFLIPIHALNDIQISRCVKSHKITNEKEKKAVIWKARKGEHTKKMQRDVLLKEKEFKVEIHFTKLELFVDSVIGP